MAGLQREQQGHIRADNWVDRMTAACSAVTHCSVVSQAAILQLQSCTAGKPVHYFCSEVQLAAVAMQ